MSRHASSRFIVLIVLCGIQLIVPAFQIAKHEVALSQGTPYRFKVRFRDPNDPLQGRYIQLAYEIDYPDDIAIDPDSRYGVLTTGEDGFARFSEIRPNKPDQPVDYIGIHLEYSEPLLYCDRYYLEESVAPEAETFFLQKMAQSDTPVWVDIRVKNGIGVIETVRIDGVPLLEAMRGDGKPE